MNSPTYFIFQGNPALYNHPAFEDFILKSFYGKHGLAAGFPEDFATTFPIGAMAFTRTVIRNALSESITGEHVAGNSVGPDHRAAYANDLKTLRKLADANIDAYHAPLIDAIRTQIATRGRQVCCLSFFNFSIDQSFCSSEMESSATFDLSGLTAAVDLYAHVNFDIPVAVLPQDEDQDADGEVDPDWND